MFALRTDLNPHVVVIGGGLAGLVAAREVVRGDPGARVTVLEATDRFGGKLRLESVAGHQVDVGAEAMLAVRPEGVDLVHDLGAGSDLVTPATTSASIWSRGALYAVPRATLMGVPAVGAEVSGLLTVEEAARAEAEVDWPTGAVADDVSVGDYVEARLGSAVVDRLVEPLLGGVYAGRAGELSLAATMPALWQAARAGESLRTVASRVLGAGSAPGSGRPMFAGIRGGMGRLPELLRADLTGGEFGARVWLRENTIARALVHHDEGFAVLVGPTTDEEWLEADAVVVATPAPAAARLLTAVAPRGARALAAIPTASSAVVTMALPRAGMPALPGSGFLVPGVDGHLIKGATFSSAKWAWTDALSPELVFVRASVGRAGEESALHVADADLVAVCAGQLGEALGHRLPAPVDSQVQRWGGGLPQYVVGHLERIAAVRAAVAAVPGLELAGAAYEGVGIPAVIASGTTAGRETVQAVRRLRRTEGE